MIPTLFICKKNTINNLNMNIHNNMYGFSKEELTHYYNSMIKWI